MDERHDQRLRSGIGKGYKRGYSGFDPGDQGTSPCWIPSLQSYQRWSQGSPLCAPCPCRSLPRLRTTRPLPSACSTAYDSCIGGTAWAVLVGWKVARQDL